MSDSPTPQVPTASKRGSTEIPENAVRVKATSVRAYSKFDEDLQEGFTKDFLSQNDRLLDTAKSLLTLQIALPGLSAALLKLVAGNKAILDQSDTLAAALILGAFLFWILGLGLSLLALKPNRYQVNPNVLERKRLDGKEDGSFSGLLDMYQKSAARRYNLILWSSVMTVSGLVLMILNWLIY